MSSSINYTRGRNRSGFTLVELLIGITVIGLLVGMVVVVGSGAINRAREFAINTEIMQISQAIENFKTENGFYPPSFEQFQRFEGTTVPAQAIVQAEANQLLPYLNKISPNHQELGVSPTQGGTWRRIDDWWINVGRHLNQSTSLQFWLSGLAHNKQFPLTGGLTPATGSGNPYVSVGFNAPLLCDATATMEDNVETESIYGAAIERRVYYDFDNTRLECFEENDPTAHQPNVSAYNVAYHKNNASGDLASFYIYRDAGSYAPPFYAGNAALSFVPNNRRNAMHAAMAYHFWDGASPVTAANFANPNTFQLVSFGMDSDPGVWNQETGVLNDFVMNDGVADPAFRGDLNSQLPGAADNLCNFANGRLDKYIDDQQ